ncbi:MAG TPA: 3-phosphoshikimate 1-carboxyvinyltransferase, partial [Pyrinomonadaceae bacterium]|nr:3-phosphoshikimate 1-carboxyvinyltransferase [Pyrinomonadaceae bacterium]
ATLACLRALGVSIDEDASSIKVHGKGLRSFKPPTGPLDCGNSGTTMRLLAGILAAQTFTSTLSGDASLSARPMRRIIDPLTVMGADVRAIESRAPLQITGTGSLQPISYKAPFASAQVKSCVLLAGLHATGRTEVIQESGITRDHTERMLTWFGAPVQSSENRYAIQGPANFPSRDVKVPGDFSAASFFIAAAALLPQSRLEISNLGLNPTRTRFLDLLRALGAHIDIDAKREECNEPVGTVKVRGSGFSSNKEELSLAVNGALSAALIDELPLLAIVGSQLPAGLTIRDARELRHKETDRIAATATNLKAMGAAVEEFEDGLHVSGGTRLKGASVQSFGDHRIAMAFSIAALIADGESEIVDSDCVSISFPGFFEVLETVVER